MTGREVIDLVQDAGLTGRGGAAFSSAVKLRAAVLNRAGLIVNACDGELGAAKDSWVVEHELAEVVRGVELLGLPSVRYAVHRGTRAEAVLRGAGLEVLSVPHRYVSSEESSLVSLAHGGLARPLTKQVPVVFGAVDARGRKLAPTLVLNAETVLRVAQIEERGVDWFRSLGTVAEPGPRLVAVGGDVWSPGVVETSAGVPVADLVAAAGGPTSPVRGVGIGGLSGGWLRPDEAGSAQWSRAGLAAYGFGTGPGILHIVSDACPLTHGASVLDRAAGESAGQCGPCMFGVPAVADDMRLLVAGQANRSDVERLRGRLGLLPGRGACRFPDGVAGYARSALRAFSAEVDVHAAGDCSAVSVPHRTRSGHAVAV